MVLRSCRGKSAEVITLLRAVIITTKRVAGFPHIVDAVVSGFSEVVVTKGLLQQQLLILLRRLSERGQWFLSTTEILPTKGIYTLIVLLETKSRLMMKRLGCFDLKKGYYAYTGSALGDGAVGLRRRVARHLRKRKIKHWHIDFLLSSKSANITTIVAAETAVNKECQINDLIRKIEGASVPIVGFGASDCKHHCESHLVYFGEENPKGEIDNAYTRVFENKSVLTLSLNPSSKFEG